VVRCCDGLRNDVPRSLVAGTSGAVAANERSESATGSSVPLLLSPATNPTESATGPKLSDTTDGTDN